MKVGFNSSALNSGHSARGIGFYTRNLLKELKEVKDLEVVEINSNPPQDLDLIHIPYFDFFFNSLSIKKIPTVVTVLDVIPLIYPKAYPSGIRGKIKLMLQKREFKKASAVITISEQSKKDINKYLRVSQDKIFVTYLAAEERFKVIDNKNDLKNISRKYKLPDKFALYIGNVNWNKNILNMARACLEANIELVLIGQSFEQRDNLNHPEMMDFNQFLKLYGNNSYIHILGYVNDSDIVGITNLAEMLLLPSRYEGFGIPVLEAQQCGVPVITSNISSLPEVAGDAAILVDPDNMAEITKAIRLLMIDQKLRNELIKKGFRNAQRFSWSKCAQETYKIYYETVKK